MFEFEFTLVPSDLDSAWFILGVQVDSMKGIFKNSLTGIFQFKYNNKSIEPSQTGGYFKSIVADCSKYIDLFYYEKMFSQFSFLSNVYGKSICSFQKSQNGDWFKFKPWFMTEESVVVSNDPRFKVDGDAESFMIPKLSFDEGEAQNVFEQLFGKLYKTKLEEFFKLEKEKGIITDFKNKNKFTFDIELFEGFIMILTINPYTKKVKFDSLNFDNFDNFDDNLESSLINFNFELFEEVIFEIKREIFYKIIKTSKNSDFSILSSSKVSSKTEICLQLKKEPSLAFSMNLNTKSTVVTFKFWKISLNYQNSFMDIKFKEITTDLNSYAVPKGIIELDELLMEQEEILLKISSKFTFENLIKFIGIEGEELENNNFRILSLGLPNCIKNVLLYEEDHLIKVKLELEGLKRSNLEINQKQENLFNYIKGIVRLFSIFEHFNLLEDENSIQIQSFEPLQLKYQKTIFNLNETGKIEAHCENKRLFELEKFIEYEEFNIYDFADKLVETKDSTLKDQEGSPDLTWLSDSFM